MGEGSSQAASRGGPHRGPEEALQRRRWRRAPQCAGCSRRSRRRYKLRCLDYFAKQYAPALRERFGDALSVNVVGSSPSRQVQALCEQQGWALHPDVTEEEMDRHFRSATFSLLPFAYATGAKLKLLKSPRTERLSTPQRVEAQWDLVVAPSLMRLALPMGWSVIETGRTGLARRCASGCVPTLNPIRGTLGRESH